VLQHRTAALIPNSHAVDDLAVVVSLLALTAAMKRRSGAAPLGRFDGSHSLTAASVRDFVLVSPSVEHLATCACGPWRLVAPAAGHQSLLLI
jgi:hypothetical protein